MRAAGAGSRTAPGGVSTLTRRRCGCLSTSATSLTRAKAISASSSCRAQAADVGATEAAPPPAASVSARLARRAGLVAKRGSRAELGLVQHLGAERHPLAVVLDGDEDRHVVGGLEHAVGRERGVAEAGCAWAAAPYSANSSGTVIHSIIAVEHGDADVGALARCGRARSAPPGWPRRRACPVPMSTRETPTRAGASGPPVTEASPDSAWISRS